MVSAEAEVRSRAGDDDDLLVTRHGHDEGLDIVGDRAKDGSGDFALPSNELAEFSSKRLALAPVVEPPPVSELPPFKPESLPVPPSPLVLDKRSLSVPSPVNPLTDPEPTDPEPTEPPPPAGTIPFSLGEPVPHSLGMAEHALSNIAFNTPEKIPYGEPSYIQFVMDPSLTKEEIVKKIREKGPVATARIKITREMEVTLTGENFDITPISEQKQMIALDETTEWKWSIVPNRPGKNRVHLVVNAIIRVDGVEMKRSKSFDRYIEIEVTGIQRTVIFFEDNWYFFAMGSVPLMFIPFRSSRLWRNRRARVKLSQGKHDESRGIDVFVSYSSRDRMVVLRLVESLRNSGFNIWVDQGGLHGASQWSEQIVEAIEQTAAFVLVGSSHSFASHNVVKETSLASEQRKPIIPIFIEEAEIPQSLQYQLAGLQRIEYSEKNHDECMTAIGEALGKLGLPGS